MNLHTITKRIVTAQLLKKLEVETSTDSNPWATIKALNRLKVPIPGMPFYRYVKILERAYVATAKRLLLQRGAAGFNFYCTYLSKLYGPSVTKALVIQTMLRKDFDTWLKSREFDAEWARVENARTRATTQTAYWERRMRLHHCYGYVLRPRPGAEPGHHTLWIAGLTREDLEAALSKNNTQGRIWSPLGIL